MGCNALFAAVPPAIRPDAKIETRIEKILGRLKRKSAKCVS